IGTVQGGSALIKKVRFPHEHLVFSVVIAQFVTLMIEFSLLTVAMMIGGNMLLPWLPLLFFTSFLLALFTSGIALFLSAANVFYHDVNYLWGILAQILFYATPVIYNPATIDFRPLEIIAMYGPTGSFITAFHNIAYDLRIPSNLRLVQLVILGVGTFLLGSWA